MKNITKMGLFMAMVLIFTACAQTEETAEPETENTVTEITEQIKTEESTEPNEQTENTVNGDTEAVSEKPEEEIKAIDPSDYAGYYNNDADDIMEIVQNDDGTYEITVFLYKSWGTAGEVLTAEGDKLVFDSKDENGNSIKCAVYPDGDGLTFEFLDANGISCKTGDKHTGFKLADTSEPLLNGAGEYHTTLATREDLENYGDMVLQEYSFEGQTMTITASFGYYPALDQEGTLSDMLLNIETTTEELPLDHAYFYTVGGDAGEQRFASFEEFRNYLDEVKDSGLGLVIMILDNQVVSVGISS